MLILLLEAATAATPAPSRGYYHRYIGGVKRLFSRPGSSFFPGTPILYIGVPGNENKDFGLEQG